MASMQKMSVARCTLSRSVKNYVALCSLGTRPRLNKSHASDFQGNEATTDDKPCAHDEVHIKPSQCVGSSHDGDLAQLQDVSQGGTTEAASEHELPDPPTSCCMSGCANCVWIQYAEQLVEIYKDNGEATRNTLKNIQDPNMKAFLQMELQIKL